MSKSSTSFVNNPVRASARVHSLLNELHQMSLEQEARIRPGHAKFVSTDSMNEGDAEDKLPASSLPGFRQDMLDKFIALDQEKCWFVYQLLLAMGATKVVEAGTSFGVSTIYLALAVGQNAIRLSGESSNTGHVIATEHEASKADRAREYWAQCGPEVSKHIDLRVGDILQTLRNDVPAEIDLVLLDIWTPLALPTLKLLLPHLKKGAVVITDNIVGGAKGYKDLLDFLSDDKGDFVNSTLPFTGGLAMSVYLP